MSKKKKTVPEEGDAGLVIRDCKFYSFEKKDGSSIDLKKGLAFVVITRPRKSGKMCWMRIASHAGIRDIAWFRGSTYHKVGFKRYIKFIPASTS